jgi:hypothetical protein
MVHREKVAHVIVGPESKLLVVCSTVSIRSSLDTFVEIERVHKLSLCHHSHVVLLFCAKEGGS